MCFSASVSLFTFSIGIIGSVLCISLGKNIDKMVGYFLGFVSLMQGIEFLLWSHQKCDNYNRFLSIVGMILNHLQPIVLGFILLIFNKQLKERNKINIIMLMIYYAMIIIPYSMPFFLNKNLECTLKGSNQHLIWKWNGMKYSGFVYINFLLVMCLLFYLGLPTPLEKWTAIFLAIFTYATSAFIYPQNTIGALWCFYVVFIPIIYYLYRIFTKNIY